jgi:AraC-like DNA-binding protein
VQSEQGDGSANVGYARVVLDYLHEHQVDPAQVFGERWLREVLGAEPGAASGGASSDAPSQHLPIDQWQWMLERAAAHLGDPALSLRLAAFIRPRHLGLLGFLLMSCDTLGAAAATLQRYELLLDSANEALCVVHADSVDIEWRALINAPSPHLIQMALALWACHGRWLSERAELSCDASFTFAAPDEPQARACYEQTFGGSVRFNQPVNKLTLPLAYLAIPVVQRNAAVHELLRAQAEADLMERAARNGGFLRQLETLLAARLDGGSVTLGSVAQELDLSPRTLQYRLDGHGLSFRALLERVRCRLAEQHLRNPALSLTEVAMMLGFADQSAFQHAFKRWKGMSPGEFRRGAQPAAQARTG